MRAILVNRKKEGFELYQMDWIIEENSGFEYAYTCRVRKVHVRNRQADSGKICKYHARSEAADMVRITVEILMDTVAVQDVAYIHHKQDPTESSR